MFAALLRTNVNTLRNWEQNRARRNAQAARLLKLVESAPQEIPGKLSALGETKPQATSGNARVAGRAQRSVAAKRKAASKRLWAIQSRCATDPSSEYYIDLSIPLQRFKAIARQIEVLQGCGSL
ncbi:MAG: hypothetical protein ABR578_07335 [Chromatocurvus sp.]